MTKWILILGVFAAHIGWAEEGTLSEWVGKWEGTVTALSGSRGRQALKKTLEVSPSQEGISWKITYEGEPTRDYVLKPVEGQSGRFILDEKNSILLEMQLVDDTFYSAFQINGRIFVMTTRKSGDEIIEDSPAFDLASASRSGSDFSGPVFAFPLSSIQRSILKRVR